VAVLPILPRERDNSLTASYLCLSGRQEREDFLLRRGNSGAQKMEGISRLVTESLARHGFDRPVDYRRLHWSRWFHCESPHSLLFVPSKPGVFVLGEEIVAPGYGGGTDGRRMLAVLQFCEDDDMAFVLDRMFSRENPMRARLVSGRIFVRFVVIEDPAQRRSICGALNQWLISSSDQASGIGAHFATSLELTPAADDGVGRTLLSAKVDGGIEPKADRDYSTARKSDKDLNSGADANLHCPSPLPSGF
jgi:hypothetical protein